ncbi:TonB-dependent siderophore receptor [Cephaloticoccus primus]|uniref:TonB-dependent siderophore receptor n=1 Tax=Cephaloticoccus primus TaxID=1548207 RepID=UPI0009ED2101|nr:TonB-dependent siderophore receptor [Cephaloticoccus primus]
MLLEELPRTVNVVTAEVMADLGETRIERALDFAGGVTRSNNLGGSSMVFYSVRGFTTGGMYRNGFTTGRGLNAAPDASTLERVEVLKGPASGLFGRGDPGGIVNLVTKRPQAERFSRITASAGSWDHYRGTLDLNTPLSASGAVLSRFNMALEDSGSFRDYVETQRYVFAPSLSWQLAPRTLLLVDGQYIRHDNTFDRGIPVIDGQVGQVPIRNFYGEPGDGKFKNKNQSFQTTLEQQVSDSWKLRLAAHINHGHMQGYYTQLGAAVPANPTFFTRSYSWRNAQWNDWHNHAELHGHFALFGWEHQVLIGAEYEWYRYDQYRPLADARAAYGIDALNPVHGQPSPPMTSFITNSLAHEKNYALNAQDQVHFSTRLIGQLGVRYDSVDVRSHNRFNNRKTNYNRDATVPRAGLLYKFTPQFSSFASAARSFRPNGTDSTGVVYDPETGVGYEVGSKFELFGGRLGGTFALFHITKENVLTPHPDPAVIDSIAVGEQRSQGLDLQISGKLIDSLRLIAAYAYIDAEVTKDNRASYQGNRLVAAPEHSGSLFAVYELPRGFEIGSAYTYVGLRKGDITNRIEMPGYSTVDFFLRWRVGENFSLTLNLNNLAGKEYYESGYSAVSVVPGTPRNFKLTLTQKF